MTENDVRKVIARVERAVDRVRADIRRLHAENLAAKRHIEQLMQEGREDEVAEFGVQEIARAQLGDAQIFARLEEAIVPFLGERRSPLESGEDYLNRINHTLADNDLVVEMLKKNRSAIHHSRRQEHHMTTVTMNPTNDTPSAQLVAKATAEASITDGKGRAITLRKPGVLAQYRLVEALGDAAKNEVYVGMVMPLVYVSAIDGDAVVPPTKKSEVEALIQRLDHDGVEAVMQGVRDHFVQTGPEEARAAIKNS